MSAYHAESHLYWCRSLMHQFPEYEWTLLSLPARHFTWRIRGNPLSFLQEYRAELSRPRDLCLATSMVDLATLKGLVPALARIPTAVYFHENQFAYPASAKQKHRLEPQMVTLYAALAADQLFFNSQYNRDTFLQGVDTLLQAMPDCKPKQLSAQLLPKSRVLPVPLELESAAGRQAARQGPVPRLLWNHRWEYDKGPELLLAIIRQLEAAQLRLRLAIIGQQFRQQPAEFSQIKSILDNSQTLALEQWGYIDSRAGYLRCLQESDLVLSTAQHDFQGLAVLEAVAAGCTPVLPAAQVYPEWFASGYLYQAGGKLLDNAGAAVELIRRFASAGQARSVPDIGFLCWPALRSVYRDSLERLLQ